METFVPPRQMLLRLPLDPGPDRDAAFASLESEAKSDPKWLDLRLALTERFLSMNRLKAGLFAAAARVRGVPATRALGTRAMRLFREREDAARAATSFLAASGHVRAWDGHDPRRCPDREDISAERIGAMPENLRNLTADRAAVRKRAAAKRSPS